MSERQLAVALKYIKEEDYAPRVIAKGRGYTAEQIMKLAKEHNIPMHKDMDLVEVLMKLDLGEFIPPELYKVIAEILAYIYKMNKIA
ncbi:MAG: flagellar biosynthesis protein FlhB [Candidatus Schekmanbacteria bacterium RBG_16_38_10]|uniref:Flagellar biosynthesis protein FlhB n=1 Tax=Candidatus Schekmanbacteria bacterium RBG_16_38_10 TaxID=1817879 RepID=A0A1F7S025_9BACT|nr:MAG: flagellar biosynthesis protein FlhB [Candidatus Schekmanbacteria bacterium RBG_16_38_10]